MVVVVVKYVFFPSLQQKTLSKSKAKDSDLRWCVTSISRGQ